MPIVHKSNHRLQYLAEKEFLEEPIKLTLFDDSVQPCRKIRQNFLKSPKSIVLGIDDVYIVNEPR